MKKLSIEEKAACYDKIIERAKTIYKYSSLYNVKDALESIFSEFRENEDEKIRKALIKYLDTLDDDVIRYGVSFKDMRAWLERQSKASKVEEAMRDIEQKAKAFTEAHKGETSDEILAQMKGVWWSGDKKSLDRLEKQSEQNSAVEPKFKVGDWVVRDVDGVTLFIESVRNGIYYFYRGGNIPVKYVDDRYHLWTIQDAKGGDVLAVEDGYQFPFIAIYKNRGLDFFNSYCFIGFDGKFYEADEGHVLDDIHPATKEQRDQLEKAMANAGYEWDAEKKELKKISKEYPTTSDECIKPAWSEGDEKFLDSILCDIGIADKTMGGSPTYESKRNWLESLKEKVQPKPQLKQEWNEEDKGNLLEVKCIIDELCSNQKVREEIDRSSEDLESLREWLDNIWKRIIKYPQDTWKPSDEIMKGLNEIINKLAISPVIHEHGYLYDLMVNLRKKLKG